MNKIKQHPIYVASDTEGNGCGHQHTTVGCAFRCGSEKLPVWKVTAKGEDVRFERVI